MKIAFLSDFFDSEIIGGAEKNDSVLINHLCQLGIQVVPVHTYMVDSVIGCYDFFIVSNFVRLSQQAKLYLMQKQNYIIYEHDHKYVVNRNPAAFKNFIIPRDKIINRDFYATAKKVFVLSKICKDVIETNLQIENTHNIACSLWSKEELNTIREIGCSSEKSKEHGILQSNNPVKGMSQTEQYCAKNNIIPSMIGSPDYVKFLLSLSLCETFIFFPQVLETFSRVCAEAKMLDCKVITTPKLVGLFSEDFSNLSGQPLIDKISDNIDAALVKFEEVIVQ